MLSFVSASTSMLLWVIFLLPFPAYPSRESRGFTCGWTERGEDITDLVVASGNFAKTPKSCLVWVAQSVQRLATEWRIRESNPGGGEIFRNSLDRPWDSTILMYNRYRVFSEVKERSGRDSDTSRLLMQWSRKSRDIALPSLRAVRPVQSHSACSL